MKLLKMAMLVIGTGAITAMVTSMGLIDAGLPRRRSLRRLANNGHKVITIAHLLAMMDKAARVIAKNNAQKKKKNK